MHTCHSKGWLHSVNPRVDFWVVADDLEGLLCVAVDNNVIKGVFHSNEKSVSADLIDSTRSAQRLASFGQLLAQVGPDSVRAPNPGGGGYKAGDVLQVRRAIQTGSGQILPVTGASSLQAGGAAETVVNMPLYAPNVLGSCPLGTPSPSVRFLVDIPESSCWLEAASLQSVCSTILDYKTINAWMLPRTNLPETDRCGDRCVLPELAESCPWSIYSDDSEVPRSEACAGQENTIGRSSSYTQDGNGCHCRNAVRSIKYTIVYSAANPANSGAIIQSVKTKVTLQDISSSDCGAVRVEQHMSVHFLEESSVALGSANRRSGNPGYVIGLPLLAATCNSFDANADTCLAFDESTLVSPFATVQGIQYDGTCAQAGVVGDEKVINFGEDAVFGCTMSYTRQELANICAAGSAPGFVNLLRMLPFGRSGNRWTHLAAYGNLRGVTEMSDAGELVEITEFPEGKSLEFDLDTNIRSSTSTCKDAIVGVKLEVLYSPFGDVQNPQARIVAARQSHVKGNLRFTKLDPNEKQLFQFHYSISFLRMDDTGQLEARYPPRPQLPIYLPYDLFYPFGLSRSKALASEHVSMGVALVLATLIFSDY